MTRRKLYEALVLVGLLLLMAGLTIALAPVGGQPVTGLVTAGAGLLAFLRAGVGFRKDAGRLDERLPRGLPPLLLAICVIAADLFLFVVAWVKGLQTTSIGFGVLLGIGGVFLLAIVGAIRWALDSQSR